MGELPDKVQNRGKSLAIDDHRLMAFRQNDAMFVVVNIGRVLQIPALADQFQRHQAQRLTGREIKAAGVVHVFHAQLTARITCVRLLPGQGNDARVFFRFGQN